MKRFLLALPLLAALCFGSCRGDEGPEGPAGPMGPAGYDGHDGKDGEGLHAHVLDLSISNNDWVVRDGFYEYVFDGIKELTADVCTDGMVTAYTLNEGNDGVTYQTDLPRIIYLDTQEDGKTIFYSKLIDYEYAPGRIIFYCTYSDFYAKEDDKPGDYQIRVVLHRSYEKNINNAK